ncbi:DUF1028 domain-containing protein [Comamonas sp. Y33R10-2]|uniref:DUF1028 domain-containing protein n=1 Tax=Comamonas sp. Y33R10-2 TaxID=2853257 RepID=UPI001C5C89B4|nr:DUF1028 domain-containing protein [Comamonas sp. Y33R10-2]QXZ08383.1 DUF1028 domain-containing protein [Comamonas sp. Y33R10-2]
MTISLAGRCARTGAMGGIISSSSPAVASRCLWVSSQGVVMTQNVTDPVLGILGIKLLEQGYGASGVISQLTCARPHIDWRQLAALDSSGQAQTFTGSQGLGIAATAIGQDCVAAGNMLANEAVLEAMVRGFESDPYAYIAERLLNALKSGLAAGGEAGPVHSAGLTVHDSDLWPCVDLRIDWSDSSVFDDLQGLWQRYQPQMRDYVTRARNPKDAPSYGVPGDP